MITPTYANTPVLLNEDIDYQNLVRGVHAALSDLPAGAVLFDTAAPDRFDIFLRHLPVHRRQHYQCRHCRDFVNRYGGIVTIAADGTRRSPLWSRRILGNMFDQSLQTLQAWVEAAPVTGVLYRNKLRYGNDPWLGEQTTPTPKAPGGRFYHLCTLLPRGVHLPLPDKAAAIREDRGVLARSLAEYSKQAALAKDLLAGDKHGPMAEWFYQVVQSVEGVRESYRDALLWRAAASARTGFCHAVFAHLCPAEAWRTRHD